MPALHLFPHRPQLVELVLRFVSHRGAAVLASGILVLIGLRGGGDPRTTPA